MTLYIFISAFLIMLASLAGVVFVSKTLSEFLEKNLKVLLAFAAGVFGVLSYSLVNETLALDISPLVFLIFLLLGALFLEITSRLIPHNHHHHERCDHHSHTRRDAYRMLLGDSVHNIADGIILVPAFLANFWVGVATAFGIFLHELVQEIAEFFVLKETGYTTRQALSRNFLVSSTILFGVLFALLLASVESFEAPLLAFAAGGFLYIIFRDLFPSIIRGVKTQGRAHVFIIAALIGVGLMVSVGTLTSHGHEDLQTHIPTTDVN